MSLSFVGSVRSCAKCAALVFGLCAVLASRVALGDTWCVAEKGSDSSEGSESAPFATVQKALSVAANGDTIKVGPGTYPLPVTTSRTVGTTAFTYGTPSYWVTNAVTIVGTDGPDVTIFDGENRANCYAFCLNNA